MKQRLSKSELAWYASGSIPGGVFALGTSFLVFYYNQVLGIPGSLIGLGALVISLFDAVSDPIAGNISDHTRGRLGRRHPYLLAEAAPPADVALGAYTLRIECEAYSGIETVEATDMSFTVKVKGKTAIGGIAVLVGVLILLVLIIAVASIKISRR